MQREEKQIAHKKEICWWGLCAGGFGYQCRNMRQDVSFLLPFFCLLQQLVAAYALRRDSCCCFSKEIAYEKRKMYNKKASHCACWRNKKAKQSCTALFHQCHRLFSRSLNLSRRRFLRLISFTSFLSGRFIFFPFLVMHSVCITRVSF